MFRDDEAKRAIRSLNDWARIYVTGVSASSAYATKVAEFTGDYALKQSRLVIEALADRERIDADQWFDHHDQYVQQLVTLPIEYAHQFSVDAEGMLVKKHDG
ncbi:MAG: hypothetical protein AAF493_02705 [Pseudomonadota bacterium]